MIEVGNIVDLNIMSHCGISTKIVEVVDFNIISHVMLQE
jgi:hypothetical protein